MRKTTLWIADGFYKEYGNALDGAREYETQIQWRVQYIPWMYKTRVPVKPSHYSNDCDLNEVTITSRVYYHLTSDYR